MGERREAIRRKDAALVFLNTKIRFAALAAKMDKNLRQLRSIYIEAKGDKAIRRKDAALVFLNTKIRCAALAAKMDKNLRQFTSIRTSIHVNFFEYKNTLHYVCYKNG